MQEEESEKLQQRQDQWNEEKKSLKTEIRKLRNRVTGLRTERDEARKPFLTEIAQLRTKIEDLEQQLRTARQQPLSQRSRVKRSRKEPNDKGSPEPVPKVGRQEQTGQALAKQLQEVRIAESE